MDKKYILLVIPSFDWHVDFRVHDAIEALVVPEWYELEKKVIARKLIHVARNEAVKDCIVWKYDYLLFCDDDNAPKPDALKLLLEADKAVIGGIIRKRNWSDKLAIYSRTYDAKWFHEYDEMKDVPESETDVIEVWNIGCWFMLYKREMLEKAYIAYDYCPFECKLSHYIPTITGERVELERWIGSPLIRLTKEGWLDVMRCMLSEDLLFHERCFMWGFKIYAHKQVTLEHYSPDGQTFIV